MSKAKVMTVEEKGNFVKKLYEVVMADYSRVLFRAVSYESEDAILTAATIQEQPKHKTLPEFNYSNWVPEELRSDQSDRSAPPPEGQMHLVPVRFDPPDETLTRVGVIRDIAEVYNLIDPCVIDDEAEVIECQN